MSDWDGMRAALRAAGVTRLRLSPSPQRFGEVFALFDQGVTPRDRAYLLALFTFVWWLLLPWVLRLRARGGRQMTKKRRR